METPSSVDPDPPGPLAIPSAPAAGELAPTDGAPRPPPAWWLLLFFLTAVLPISFLAKVMGGLQAGRGSLLIDIVSTQVAFLLPALAWARLSGWHPPRLLRLTRSSPAGLLLGLGVGLGSILAGAGVMALWRIALPASLLARFDVGRELATQGWSPWLLLLLAAFLPALCEEIAFRGALQTALMRGRSRFGAVVGAAVIFATLHLDPVRFPGVLLVGLAFGWLAWRTGSLWPGVLAHAVNNGAAVLLFTLAGAGEVASANPTETLPAAESAALLAAGLALLAVAVSAARRWLPPAPEPASFLVPRGAGAATTAGEAPSP